MYVCMFISNVKSTMCNLRICNKLKIEQQIFRALATFCFSKKYFMKNLSKTFSFFIVILNLNLIFLNWAWFILTTFRNYQCPFFGLFWTFNPGCNRPLFSLCVSALCFCFCWIAFIWVANICSIFFVKDQNFEQTA